MQGAVVGYVFGYGSLAHPQDWALQGLPVKAIYGHLSGYRRTWQVALENADPRYDHKHYKHKGERIECAVATLGIYSCPSGPPCNGLAIPVTKSRLDLLKQREISYQMSEDISNLFSQDLPLPLWAYVPSKESYQIYRRNENNVFLPESYLSYCQEAFAYWDPSGGWRDFLVSTDPLPCPLLDLRLWRAAGKAGL